MKKVYWSCISIALICVVLDLIFTCLDMVISALITSIVMVVFILIGVVIYFCFVKFKCQKCNTIFKGKSWEIFFALHTPTKRYMRCPICQQRVWCEDYFEKLKDKNKETKEVEDVK